MFMHDYTSVHYTISEPSCVSFMLVSCSSGTYTPIATPSPSANFDVRIKNVTGSTKDVNVTIYTNGTRYTSYGLEVSEFEVISCTKGWSLQQTSSRMYASGGAPVTNYTTDFYSVVVTFTFTGDVALSGDEPACDVKLRGGIIGPNTFSNTNNEQLLTVKTDLADPYLTFLFGPDVIDHFTRSSQVRFSYSPVTYIYLPSHLIYCLIPSRHNRFP
jgi:hypothetical protein